MNEDIENMIAATCQSMMIPTSALRRHSRMAEIVKARHVMTILLIKVHGLTMRQIAGILNLDRTTIYKNLQAANNLIDTDPIVRRKYNELYKRFNKCEVL